ncbi:hypothetical protein A9Q73_07410, partial [Bermanella sp. 47_1433_sub80_T6]
MSRLFLITLLGLLCAPQALAKPIKFWSQRVPTAVTPPAPQVELSVIDTYLELHTGPGRGYPIFHVIEQGQSVKVLRRRSNWFYVSDRRNTQGWVKQESLARTLAPTGMPAALPDIQHGDFLAQQGRIGFSVGQLGTSYTANVTAGYRLLSFAGIEVEYGQIFKDLEDGSSVGATVIIEPIKSWSFTPFISKGIAWQDWKKKKKSSVGGNSFSSNSEFTGAGINYYIGFNFV